MSEERCPECGAILVPSHPKRGKAGQVLHYRRSSCPSCPYYQARTISTGFQKRQPLSLEEIEQMQNKKAEKYFPKDNMLLKKQTGRNTKDL